MRLGVCAHAVRWIHGLELRYCVRIMGFLHHQYTKAAAFLRFRDRNRAIPNGHREPDHLVTGIHQQYGRQRRIHPAAHAHRHRLL